MRFLPDLIKTITLLRCFLLSPLLKFSKSKVHRGTIEFLNQTETISLSLLLPLSLQQLEIEYRGAVELKKTAKIS